MADPRRRHTTGTQWALAAALLALVFEWVFATAVQSDELRPCGRIIQEAESWSQGLALWPPGATSCEINRRDGTTERATSLPWRVPVAAALWALAAFAFTSGLARRRWPPALAAIPLWWLVAFDVPR